MAFMRLVPYGIENVGPVAYPLGVIHRPRRGMSKWPRPKALLQGSDLAKDDPVGVCAPGESVTPKTLSPALPVG